jgi:peptide/nickel transport system permease protein
MRRTRERPGAVPLTKADKTQARRIRRFDNPWLNPKLF